MRKLLIFIITAALAWSIYWAVGSAALTAGVSNWFEDRRAEGWVADYSDMKVVGYPNRLDTFFTDLSLADPDTGLAWDAPEFELYALSYKPNHVIAVWPTEQRIATPVEKFRLKTEDMRASLITRAATTLPLSRLNLTAKSFEITPQDKAQPITARSIALAAEQNEDKTPLYRLGLSAEGFAPALEWRVQLDPSGNLPETLDALRVDASVAFDKEWDLSAIEEARPQPRSIDLHLAEARWGRLELQAAGAVEVNARGVPTGEITIKARNWREILRLSVESGALPAGFADTLKDGLTLLSQLSGNPKTLDIPLGFKGGQVFLGPVPIGPSPVLKIR